MSDRFETFTLLLGSISRSIYRIKTEEMNAFGLKSSHLSCIYYLYKNETLTARELCDCCDEDKANISRAIKYLEENGYLLCFSKTQKRYQCPLRLTERGREVGHRISERIAHVLEMSGFGVSEEDRTAMYRSLAQIADNMEKACEQYDQKQSKFSLKKTFSRLKPSVN